MKDMKEAMRKEGKKMTAEDLSKEPVFPVVERIIQVRPDAFVKEELTNVGLTKREYFACAAMQGILAGLPETANYCQLETARVSVLHADSLLAELTKGKAE